MQQRPGVSVLRQLRRRHWRFESARHHRGGRSPAPAAPACRRPGGGRFWHQGCGQRRRDGRRCRRRSRRQRPGRRPGRSPGRSHCPRIRRSVPDPAPPGTGSSLKPGQSPSRVRARGFARILTPTPASRPGPRLRRGRSKARAPVARKPCLLAPQERGFDPSPVGRRCPAGADEGTDEVRCIPTIGARQPE
ncbi:hypothetical protein XHV734_1766 [Xanthomonas hortorum pv. vitians]|nr:hypothetical protein XHV734_1766 [Xanthomonas hortorum pv. vitians]